MRIRDAAPGDAAALAEIANHYISETAVTFTTVLKTAETVRQEIATRRDMGHAYLVAEEGGMPLGFATYSTFRAGPGYARTFELSILLRPGAEGQGTGRRLMTSLQDHARQAGVHSLIAGISAENPGAVGFHAAMGFAQVGRIPQAGRKFGRWIDLILMQKLLS